MMNSGLWSDEERGLSIIPRIEAIGVFWLIVAGSGMGDLSRRTHGAESMCKLTRLVKRKAVVAGVMLSSLVHSSL